MTLTSELVLPCLSTNSSVGLSSTARAPRTYSTSYIPSSSSYSNSYNYNSTSYRPCSVYISRDSHGGGSSYVGSYCPLTSYVGSYGVSGSYSSRRDSAGTTSPTRSLTTDSDSLRSTQARSHTGLKNLGNTCFMNSIVQCLANTHLFAQYFVDERHNDHINPKSPQRGEVAEEFGAVVKALKGGTYKTIAMRDFKRIAGVFCPEFRGNDQHDAHEFLMNLADWLHNDLNLVQSRLPPMAEQNFSVSTPDYIAADEVQKAISIRDRSIVRQLFYGLHRNVILCNTCHQRSLTFEPFFVLTLSFPSNDRFTLQDLLMHYYKSSTIEYKCSQCNRMRQCTRKMDIWQLPPVLIIHLNRFEQRDFLMTKNPSFVDFPVDNLALSKYVVDNPKQASHNHNYALFSVCNHFGTIDGGHYTAFCNSAPDSSSTPSWHKYDDHEVYDMTARDVRTSAAYVLFFQRKSFGVRGSL